MKMIEKRLYLCLASEKYLHRRRMYPDAILTRTKTTGSIQWKGVFTQGRHYGTGDIPGLTLCPVLSQFDSQQDGTTVLLWKLTIVADQIVTVRGSRIIPV